MEKECIDKFKEGEEVIVYDSQQAMKDRDPSGNPKYWVKALITKIYFYNNGSCNHIPLCDVLIGTRESKGHFLWGVEKIK